MHTNGHMYHKHTCMTITHAQMQAVFFFVLVHHSFWYKFYFKNKVLKQSCQIIVYLYFRALESAVFLVGNKQDLCHMREVGWEEGQKLALDNRCQFCELSAAEHSLEVEMMFIRIIKDILTNFKLKEKRRSSGSKSMAKLINNVFGKRRKSV